MAELSPTLNRYPTTERANSGFVRFERVTREARAFAMVCTSMMSLFRYCSVQFQTVWLKRAHWPKKASWRLLNNFKISRQSGLY